MLRTATAALSLALVAAPVVADAQGLVGGARRGYNEGDRALGPIGGVVGGAVGAGIGTVNGALGIHPHYFFYHGRRCFYRHHSRVCR